MDERIDLSCPLSRAHWCGNFSCTDVALVLAVEATESTDVGIVGLYLATSHERKSRRQNPKTDERAASRFSTISASNQT